jgi:hypothetical protein
VNPRWRKFLGDVRLALAGQLVPEKTEKIFSGENPDPKKFAERYIPMPDTEGGADFALVEPGDLGKPSCVLHGAMNKVSPSPPGYWRCVTTAGPKVNSCRAGCMERQ